MKKQIKCELVSPMSSGSQRYKLTMPSFTKAPTQKLNDTHRQRKHISNTILLCRMIAKSGGERRMQETERQAHNLNAEKYIDHFGITLEHSRSGIQIVPHQIYAPCVSSEISKNVYPFADLCLR